MGRFHHSKKAHSEGKEKRKNKFTIGKTGNKKLADDFVYTQKHKNIWNSFCNFLDERFAEEDLSEILDAEEIARLKIPLTIPAQRMPEIKNQKKRKEPEQEHKFSQTNLTRVKNPLIWKD